MPSKKPSERQLIICSRLADGYHLTPNEEKHVQHMLTQWIPQVIYPDLPDDAVRVTVVIRRSQYGSQISNKKVYRVTFFRKDGSIIPVQERGRLIDFKDYDEDLVAGKTLGFFDPRRDSKYGGKVMGENVRFVTYKPPANPTAPRS